MNSGPESQMDTEQTCARLGTSHTSSARGVAVTADVGKARRNPERTGVFTGRCVFCLFSPELKALLTHPLRGRVGPRAFLPWLHIFLQKGLVWSQNSQPVTEGLIPRSVLSGISTSMAQNLLTAVSVWFRK